MELRRLDPDHNRPAFSCGNPDLDDFYFVDSIDYANQLLSVTYAFFDEEKVVAFFSVSNDSIRKEDSHKKATDLAGKKIPPEKFHTSLPATKIGRLGITAENHSNGLGTIVLDYLKAWFVFGNKTGCRFLLIDAYNQPRVVAFYKKNGFRFLTKKDKDDRTRIMFYDLKLIANRVPKKVKNLGSGKSLRK